MRQNQVLQLFLSNRQGSGPPRRNMINGETSTGLGTADDARHIIRRRRHPIAPVTERSSAIRDRRTAHVQRDTAAFNAVAKPITVARWMKAG